MCVYLKIIGAESVNPQTTVYLFVRFASRPDNTEEIWTL